MISHMIVAIDHDQPTRLCSVEQQASLSDSYFLSPVGTTGGLLLTYMTLLRCAKSPSADITGVVELLLP